MNKLKTLDLHKSYGNGAKSLEVLKEINIEIKDNAFVCIVGPSGAGKSTLLHLLGGLDAPSKGKVLFDGADLAGMTEIQRSHIRNKRIGFVFQFYHLLPELSVLENVMLPGMIAALEADALKIKATDILNDVGLGERLTHRPYELSGGEQQRTAIARALINEPEVILCDEPTGNLDSKTGEHIIQLLRRLNAERGKTIVIVTHEKAMTNFAQQVINIKDGRII